MANSASPTPASLTAEVAELRTRTTRVIRNLTPEAFNWQPGGGTKWSIGQCLDHLARGNSIYLDAVTQAINRAPAGPLTQPARANWLARWFIWYVLEPPPRARFTAPKAIQPVSDLDMADTIHGFDESLDRLVDLLPRAWAIDPNRTRFKNPLASGMRLFNVTAAFQILTSHGRRHLWQAEQVRARPDWPGPPASGPTSSES